MRFFCVLNVLVIDNLVKIDQPCPWILHNRANIVLAVFLLKLNRFCRLWLDTHDYLGGFTRLLVLIHHKIGNEMSPVTAIHFQIADCCG